MDSRRTESCFNNNNNGGGRKEIYLRDVNSCITCTLCGGYFVDATALVDCLHTFCRSCILKYFENCKMSCPKCEIIYKKKTAHCFVPDHQMQALVYKLVPGLYAREMQRREDFYRSTGMRASSSCSDDSVLGEQINDHDRWVNTISNDQNQYFSPDDSISLSLEYYQRHLDDTDVARAGKDDAIAAPEVPEDDGSDVTRSTESTKKATRSHGTADVNDRRTTDEGVDAGASDNASKCGAATGKVTLSTVECSDGNRDGGDAKKDIERVDVDGKKITGEETVEIGKTRDRRYLQCPAAVTMSHLQKFVRMKFALSNEHKVDVIYRGEVLPPYFNLMDVAYTFHWNRTKPMRFFYRIFIVQLKVRPIRIINTSSIGEKKQLQIVPVKPCNSDQQSIASAAAALTQSSPSTASSSSSVNVHQTDAKQSNKERHMATLQLQSSPAKRKRIRVIDDDDDEEEDEDEKRHDRKPYKSPKCYDRKRSNAIIDDDDDEDEEQQPKQRQADDGPHCVYEYEEPDKEERKRFAEIRDIEWAMQKELDRKEQTKLATTTTTTPTTPLTTSTTTSTATTPAPMAAPILTSPPPSYHHVSKKRKKNKHSRNDAGYKKRKLHAEITSSGGVNADEDSLKLKVKLFKTTVVGPSSSSSSTSSPPNGHRHKHSKSNVASEPSIGKSATPSITCVASSATTTTTSTTASAPLQHSLAHKEKLFKMRQVRHKHAIDKSDEVIVIDKDEDDDVGDSSAAPPPPKAKAEIKSTCSASASPSPSSSAIAGKTLRSDFACKTMSTTGGADRQAQTTFLKTFQSYTEKFHHQQQQQKQIGQFRGEAKCNAATTATTPAPPIKAEVAANSNKRPNNQFQQQQQQQQQQRNNALERTIATLQKQQCTVEAKRPSEAGKQEKRVKFAADAPKQAQKAASASSSSPAPILNSASFTVSKVESGASCGAAGDEADKRPSLEITLVNPTASPLVAVASSVSCATTTTASTVAKRQIPSNNNNNNKAMSPMSNNKQQPASKTIGKQTPTAPGNNGNKAVTLNNNNSKTLTSRQQQLPTVVPLNNVNKSVANSAKSIATTSTTKKPLPATIPLDRIRKPMNLKSGISIIPKMIAATAAVSERCDNIGALDLSKPNNKKKPLTNGYASGGTALLLNGRAVEPSPPPPPPPGDKINMQLSNLQMLSKVASEHSSINKLSTGKCAPPLVRANSAPCGTTLLNNRNNNNNSNSVNRAPAPPNLTSIKMQAAIKIPSPQNSLVGNNAGGGAGGGGGSAIVKPNLAKLPKLNEINKTQFRLLNNHSQRNARQNQNVRNIPNPSLLVRQNQNRLNSMNSAQKGDGAESKSIAASNNNNNNNNKPSTVAPPKILNAGLNGLTTAATVTTTVSTTTAATAATSTPVAVKEAIGNSVPTTTTKAVATTGTSGALCETSAAADAKASS